MVQLRNQMFPFSIFNIFILAALGLRYFVRASLVGEPRLQGTWASVCVALGLESADLHSWCTQA